MAMASATSGDSKSLDYLQELGVNAIWLLPFYPSPLRDDGYDIADYYWSTAATARWTISSRSSRLRRLVAFASSSRWCSITPPTSIRGSWRPRSSHDNPKRDWYVWSETDDRYRQARIIFLDTELSNWAWDPISKSYYWHRFFSHQPDLNFDNPEVCEALWDVMKFWLEMGVDGFRLDAVPYLVEREGTNLREPARDPCHHARSQAPARRVIPGQNDSRRSQSMAGRCARLLRERR